MKKFLTCLAVLLALIMVVFTGLALFIGTLDADKYRPQLVDAIRQKTGRAVTLNGPIGFSLGLGGVQILVQDASIANPAWASRPDMARMGKFEMDVGLLPLLERRVAVKALSIENADILLEANAAGNNWTFSTAVPSVSVSSSSLPSPPSSSPASLSVSNLTITNSQIALRKADGETTSINVASLNVAMRGAGAELTFNGDANGVPVTLKLKTGIADLLSRSPFSFDADASYGAFHLAAQGNADPDGGKADMVAYQVDSATTSVQGKGQVTWNGERPTIKGTLTSDYVDTEDFTAGAAGSGNNKAAPQPAGTEQTPDRHLFTDTPLPLEALRAFDVDLDIAIGEFPLGADALRQIRAKLVLSNGDLMLSPVKASVGAAPVDVQLHVNAAQTPAQVTLSVVANGVDLGDLQKLGGMAAFMTGKAGAAIQLTGSGNSAHDIAASLGGVMTVTAEKGEIMAGAAAGVSSLLAALFGAQGNDTLHCLAARFIVKKGVLNDNGILIDSVASTVAGNGAIDLGHETVKMVLRAKTKLVDIGGLVPTLEIKGDLSSPRYSVDAASIVQNVVGSLLNGDVDVVASTVPDILTPPMAGQNACVYTLDHPKATSSPGVLPPDAAGKVSQKLKKIGNSLLNGLFGQ